MDSDPEFESRDSELLGQVIAERYRVEKLLGEGGMGAVYRATHLTLQKPVAIKVLHREMTLNEEARKRFEREAVVSARIEHPHVTGATDFGKLPDGSCFLVLDYVSGESLKHLLAQEKRIDAERALHIVRQIALALEAAHGAGVIHRDLKPENVMLIEHKGETDFVKVLDFGIARLESRDSGSTVQLTQAGAVFGTPEYMSPEQCAGNVADGRADLYTLGIMLFEMLSGETPFQGETIVGILTQHLTADPPELPGPAPESLRRVVRKLLQKDPELRFQSARELIDALDQVETPSTARTLRAPALPEFEGERLRSFARTGLELVRTRALPVIRHWSGLPVQVRGRTLPLWQPAIAALCLGILLVWLAWPSSAARDVDGATEEPLVAASGERAPGKPAIDLARVRVGNADALKQLEALAPETRSAEQWAALVVGELRAGNAGKSLAALEGSKAKVPSLEKDAEVLGAVATLALGESTSEAALGQLATRGGSRGADLLYAWSKSAPAYAPKDFSKRSAATLALSKDKSPALRIALELDEARACSAVKELLPRAKTDADDRASAGLQKKTLRRGCGMFNFGDCWRCLRGNDDLQKALVAAKSRPAPELVAPLLAPSGAASSGG
jgi:serine/threonine-protein kinase